MITGFRGVMSREQGDEMLRLLREGHRVTDERFTHLDAQLREQYARTDLAFQRLAESTRETVTEMRANTAYIKEVIRRLDAIIRGRNNGEPPA